MVASSYITNLKEGTILSGSLVRLAGLLSEDLDKPAVRRSVEALKRPMHRPSFRKQESLGKVPLRFGAINKARVF